MTSRRAIPFKKVHACGNDFVVLTAAPNQELVTTICDRQHGIGADGIMVIESVSSGEIVLDHFDPDGSRSFCLNGIRATLAALQQEGQISANGSVQSAGVKLRYQMQDFPVIQINLAQASPVEIVQSKMTINGWFVDVGNPQLVILDYKPRWLVKAPALRAHPDFHNGTNVTFVRPIDEAQYQIKTYERGVEGFTLACGSGVVAAACVLANHGEKLKRFLPDGGDWIDVSLNDDGLALTGPTHWVAEGEFLCG